MSKAKRKGLSKRLRFEVFKRDGFRCTYCGATPAQSILHVDHVEPVSKGGTDEPCNLVTACADCNGGKSNVPLDRRKLAPSMSTEDAAEHAEQLRAYLALQREIAGAKRDLVAIAEEHWEDAAGWELTARQRVSIRTFVDRLGVEEVMRAIDIAASKFEAGTAYQAGKLFAYFCGICWRWIRGEQEQAVDERVDADDEGEGEGEDPEAWKDVGLGCTLHKSSVAAVARIVREARRPALEIDAQDLSIVDTVSHGSGTMAKQIGDQRTCLLALDNAGPRTLTAHFDMLAVRLLLQPESGEPVIFSIPWRAILSIHDLDENRLTVRRWELAPKSYWALPVEVPASNTSEEAAQ